jgi:hypothetical protein
VHKTGWVAQAIVVAAVHPPPAPPAFTLKVMQVMKMNNDKKSFIGNF